MRYPMSQTLQQYEAFAIILLMTVGADGQFTDQEFEDLHTRTSRMHLFGEVTRNQHDAIPEAFRAMLMTNMSVEQMIAAAAAAMHPLYRETAFAVAVDLVYSDGEVGEEEVALIQMLHAGLGIESALADAVVRAASVRFRG